MPEISQRSLRRAHLTAPLRRCLPTSLAPPPALPWPGPAMQAQWALWSIGWTAQAAAWMQWTL